MNVEHEKPKTPLRSARWIGGGVVVAAVVAIIVWHGAGNGSGQPHSVSDPAPKPGKPLNLGTPGPIEHYVQKLEPGDFTDEWWENTVEGYSREERKMVDDATLISINKNGYYYQMFYDSKGKLVQAGIYPQPKDYDEKLTVFDRMKPKNNWEFLKKTTLNGIAVDVYKIPPSKDNPPVPGLYSEVYVDSASHLPIKEDHYKYWISFETLTWTYSYLDQDGSLFDVPTNIDFQES